MMIGETYNLVENARLITEAKTRNKSCSHCFAKLIFEESSSSLLIVGGESKSRKYDNGVKWK